MEYRLDIGDVIASARTANYTCYGLGSRIGLFLQDRSSSLSAGAHIFLPASGARENGWNKYYDAPSAIDSMLRQLEAMGSNLLTLRAKIAGGANVVAGGQDTGSRIYSAVVQELVSRRIYIAATDVGGIFARTARFSSSTGELLVHLPQKNERKIY